MDRGASVSYNFLHLTVQEYLAAYHISQQSRDEQVAFMREHSESEKLEVVGRFLAGLTELGRDLCDVVRGFASEDNSIKLKVLHWLFESQDPSAFTSVLGSDYVYYSQRGALPFDLYVLGYCIAHSSCDWKLELDDCELESVEMFLKVLNLKQEQGRLPSTGWIKEINFCELKVHELQSHQSVSAAACLLLDNMPHLLVFRKLTHLVMMSCDTDHILEIINHLSKQTELLQQLECLRLSYDCGDYVEFGVVGIEPEAGITLNPGGIDCGEYVKVNLREAGIEPEAGMTLNPGGVAVNLITPLTKFSTIRELSLIHVDIGFEDCKVLGELLASSTYIDVLDISENGLSSDSVQLIVDGLSHNTSLEKLNMRDNPIGSEGAVAFASMLKKNQCLKTLWLNHSSVGVEGALELIESLKHNTTLEELVLSRKCQPPSFFTLDKTLQDRVKFTWVHPFC